MTLSIPPQMPNDLYTLACWMAGDFSNRVQAEANPQLYAHIRIFFRPLPFAFFDAFGFYSEQVYDYDLWNPYRQGIHRLVDWGNRIYIENYALHDPLRYAGAARDDRILASITPDLIQRRLHCSMVFSRHGNCFRGSVEPGNRCLILRNGIHSYLVSHVELTESTWISLDCGLDLIDHKHLWGSTHGPLRFHKRQSFQLLLP